ncbi:MAG: phytanoyl-CoA dioxygenase family protein [Betaproteobacteria bacterium]|nr:phytanoyl-CoA dioxygenase family protein [Betaproteobacteria bacterium]
MFSADEVHEFNSEGYVVARGLASPAQCAAIRAVAERDLAAEVAPVEYEADTRYPGAPQSLDAPGGRTVRRLLQAYARDPVIAKWAVQPEMRARLEQLLGPRVELSQAHHNCVMTKNPSYSSITNWHQDIRYWSFDRPELVSVWVALGHEYFENGALMVLPGSHMLTYSPEQVDEALFLRTDVEANKPLVRTQRRIELAAGDVLFFHCRLFHAAGHNQTAETKFSLVFSYHAADNRPRAGTRSASLPDIAV